MARCVLAQALQELVRSGADDVKTAALETVGNLAFCRANRPAILAAPALRDWLARLAQDKVSASTAPARPVTCPAMLGVRDFGRALLERQCTVDLAM